MNWDAIGAIGEILGSLGVLLTLLYLAVQVSHAKNEMKRSVRQSRSDTLRGLYVSRLSNPTLVSIYSKTESMRELSEQLAQMFELSNDEASLLIFDQLAWWQYSDQVILDRADLSEGERHQFDSGLVIRYFGDSAGGAWYKLIKHHLNPVSVRYVDELIAKQPSRDA